MKQKNKIIYCDIDFVLQDFVPDFIGALRWLFGIKIAREEFDDFVKNEKDIIDPIQSFCKKIGLDQSQIKNVIRQSSSDSICWKPTPFGETLAKFLVQYYITTGNKIIIISSRRDRESAQKLIKNIFNEIEIPVITCESEYKHLVIKSDSIYFEDYYKIVNNCGEFCPKTQIYVPRWPWNVSLIKDYPNIHICEHSELNDINFLNSLGGKNCVLNKKKLKTCPTKY